MNYSEVNGRKGVHKLIYLKHLQHFRYHQLSTVCQVETPRTLSKMLCFFRSWFITFRERNVFYFYKVAIEAQRNRDVCDEWQEVSHRFLTQFRRREDWRGWCTTRRSGFWQRWRRWARSATSSSSALSASTSVCACEVTCSSWTWRSPTCSWRPTSCLSASLPPSTPRALSEATSANWTRSWSWRVAECRRKPWWPSPSRDTSTSAERRCTRNCSRGNWWFSTWSLSGCTPPCGQVRATLRGRGLNTVKTRTFASSTGDTASPTTSCSQFWGCCFRSLWWPCATSWFSELCAEGARRSKFTRGDRSPTTTTNLDQSKEVCPHWAWKRNRKR